MKSCKQVKKWTSTDGITYRWFLDIRWKVHVWTCNGKATSNFDDERMRRLNAAADKVCKKLDQRLWAREARLLAKEARLN